MTPENHPERRHRQPGRRSGDARAYGDAAMAEADERIIPSSWTVGKVTRWLTLLALLGTLVGGAITFLSARYATRKEVGEIIKPAVDTLSMQSRRMANIEAKQREMEAVHQLLPASVRLQCLRLEQDHSMSLASIAGLPCDSLLRRIQR